MLTRCLAILIPLAIFAASSLASAASIDLLVSLVPGTTDWTFSVDVNVGSSLRAVGVTTGPAVTGFAIQNPNIEPLISEFDVNLIGDGRNLLILNAAPQPSPPIAMGPALGVLLGTFHTTTSNGSLLGITGAEDFLGGTVFDDAGVPIASYRIVIAPEPAVAALSLLSLGAAAARVIRRRL